MADPVSAPSGIGGLLRYNEEYPSKLQISPEIVVAMIVVVVIAMAALKLIT